MRHWWQIRTGAGPVWVEPGQEEAARRLLARPAPPAPAPAAAHPPAAPAGARVLASYWRSPGAWVRL